MSLLILGSAAFDSIRTPFGSRERVIGGSAVYASFAASFFTPVRMVSVVGSDWTDTQTNQLRQKGIDIEGLEFQKNEKTLYWSGNYFENMDDRETLDIQLNVMGKEYDPIVPDAYKDSEYVFLANGSPTSHLALLSKLNAPRLVVADTMDFYIQNTPDALFELMKKIDGLILNDSEAKMLTGEQNPISAARKILTFGPRFTIIKKGENGAMYFSKDEIYFIPAFPTEKVVDPTGAGDSFAGALMGSLAASGNCDGNAVKKSMADATIVASYNVEGFSLERLGEINKSDLQTRFDAFKKMITF